MKRRHLFEFEDLEWWPQSLRNYVTEFLAHMVTEDQTYSEIVEPMSEAFQRSGARRFVDFCSGSCGTSLFVLEGVVAALDRSVEILLSDKFPNLERFAAVAATREHCSYVPYSVDILNAPKELDGFRTIFNALHHFQPPQVRAIFENAVESRAPIATFEFTERRAAQVALGMMAIPALTLLATPRLRPLTPGRLFWTYVAPIVPLTCAWDGIVSSIRSYEPSELMDIAKSADRRDSFDWTVTRGERRPGHAPFRVTCLIGLPR